MDAPKTIPRSGPLDPFSNYQELLRLGMRKCQEFGSDQWTDYNLHDPGVTILQQVCYALTDLAYRTDFPIPDLLAVDNGEIAPEQTLYTGDRILTCSPITVTDYRKFLYDRIDGVKNAWLLPVKDHPLGIQGLYEVLIEVREDIEESETPRVLSDVRKFMRTARNLGEDVGEIRLLKPQPIRLEATLEIDPTADPSNVLAQVLFDIQCSLVPFPSVQNIDELFQNHTPDEVWNGPRLELGALEPQSLQERKETIEVQEIAQIVLRVPEVKRVKITDAGTVDDNGNWLDSKRDPNLIKIQDGHLPRLYPSILKPQVSYSIDVNLEGGFKTSVDARAVWLRILEKETGMRNRIIFAERSLQASEYRSVPAGKFRDVKKYFSMQEQFPAVYGLGKYGTGKSLIAGEDRLANPDIRQARMRQLKAFLLFFEQPMADYLSQLANVGSLFSVDQRLESSYAYQPLAHDPPLSSDPHNVAEVLVQTPESAPRVSEHYLVCIVDPRGEIIFASREIASLEAARARALQLRECGQHIHNYRIHSDSPNSVQIAVYSADGEMLALGRERFASSAKARTAAERWSRFLTERAGTKATAEMPVRIFGRENRGLQIINEESQIVLSAIRAYAQEEREQRIGELLQWGIDRRNYRVRPTTGGFYRVDLHNPQDESVAEGGEIFATEGDAEEGAEQLLSLLRRIKEDASLRERFVRGSPKTGKVENRTLRFYEEGLARLSGHEDRDFLKRRNKMLNHLLARFNERFDDSLLERLDLRLFGQKDNFFREMIRWKIQFLRHYVEGNRDLVSLGGGRALGWNYGEEEGAGTASGLERRTCLLLGMHGHENSGGYSAQGHAAAAPSLSYLEKYVWPPELEQIKQDDHGNPLTVSRYRIAGSWSKGEPDLNDLHHNFVFSSVDSSVLSELISTGLNRESYMVRSVDGEYPIFFRSQRSGEVTEIHRAHSRAEAEDALTALLRYFRSLGASAAQSYAGERMYVVEHVLLRPQGDAGKCSVPVPGPEHGPHLRSIPVERSRKGENLERILTHGRHETNYRVRPHRSGKHEVVLLFEEQPIATGSHMFDSEQEATLAIAYFVETLRSPHRHRHRPVKPAPAASADADFYSYRVSVIFPNWPARFQNDEFRLYAEQLMYENAPAHIAVDCFWLTAYEMAEFEKHYTEWKKLKRTAAQTEDEMKHGKNEQPSSAETKSSALDESAAALKGMIEGLQEKKQRNTAANAAGKMEEA